MSLNDTHGPEIQSLYEEGVATTKLAVKYNTSPNIIRAILIKRGVTMRTQGVKGRRPDRDLFNDEQVSEIRKRYANGENMASIGRAFNTSQTTIDKYLKKVGDWKPRQSISSHGQEILEELVAGTHVDEVASKYNTTRGNIYSVINRMGINLLEIAVLRRASVRPTKEVLAKIRWEREKAKMEVDPSFRAYMLEKYKRQYDALDSRYAPAMAAFREVGCKVCGDKRSHVLDAHHRDPNTKLFSIGSRTKLKITVEELENELKKCVCLCAFHHRVLHKKQGDNQPAKVCKSKSGQDITKARARLQPLFDDFKSDGCWICNRTEPEGLSAHHIKPELKSFELSRAASLKLSNDLTLREMAKCACLCESCHRLVHAGEIECPSQPLPNRTDPYQVNKSQTA